MEEFEESDVIFSDDASNNQDDLFLGYREMIQHNSRASRTNCNNSSSSSSNNNSKSGKRKKKKSSSNAIPVNIPGNIFHYTDTDEFEEGFDDGEIIPPHVIIGRRIQGKMAFSVCTGNGRTLKGRDLSQVRNSILRMTGFLET